MSVANQLIEDMLTEGNKLRYELNRDYYITSFLEDDFLYHTTRWKTLKSIWT